MGFNSQRDGILLYYVCGRLVHEYVFQFPTGWNSTVFLGELYIVFTVSIPNGMEFYAFYHLGVDVLAMFQFPTGWNSTLSSLCVRLGLCCFNSQRDGILRKLHLC